MVHQWRLGGHIDKKLEEEDEREEDNGRKQASVDLDALGKLL